MKTLLKAIALSSVAVAASSVAVPAAAQSKLGIGVASLDVAVARTNAFTNGMKSIETTYKAQIDKRNQRGTVLQDEVQALESTARAEEARTPRNAAAYQAAVTAYQNKARAAQQEIDQLNAPIQLAAAYVEEQINLKMDAAVKAAMAKRKVDLVLSPEAVVSRANGVDITDAIIAELNTMVPSVSVTPPANYRPGQLIQAARTATATPAPATPATQPQTR